MRAQGNGQQDDTNSSQEMKMMRDLAAGGIVEHEESTLDKTETAVNFEQPNGRYRGELRCGGSKPAGGRRSITRGLPINRGRPTCECVCWQAVLANERA